MQTQQTSLIKKTTSLVVVIIISLVFNHKLNALDLESDSASFFYSYEVNHHSYITGVGAIFYESYANNKFGSQFTSSLNTAKILTKQGDQESYFAWEASATYGYFSDIFIYGEIGLDLTELLLEDFLENNCQNCNDERQNTNGYSGIDGFVGLAAGVDLNKAKLEGFVRLRKIDSKYERWDAGTNWFSGVKFSIDF